MRRPLLYLLAALAAGIIAGAYFTLPYHLLLAMTTMISIFIGVSVRKKWFTAALICAAGFLFLLGFFNIQKQIYFPRDDFRILRDIDQGKVTVEGLVTESPISYQEKDVLIIRCLRIFKNQSYTPTEGIVRLSIPPGLDFHYGDYIRFQSNLKKIQNFNNPGCFDYERYMNLQGIYVSGFVSDRSEIVLLRKDTSGSLRLKLEEFRSYLKQIIIQNSATPEREVLEAMTLGNQNEIPDDIRDAFNKTGTSHILSISGLHIGMVAGTFFLLIFLVLKSSEYLMLRFNIIKLAAAAAFIIVLFYAFIAGLGVPVMRATLMAFVFLVALLSGKQKDMHNTLALAGLIILVLSPDALFDISFQLSFASVWAIILIVPVFSNLLPTKMSAFPGWVRSITRYVYLTMIVGLAATLGTLPLIVYYFDRVSLVTLIANLIAVPLLGTLTLAAAMFFILFSFAPVLSGYCIQLASFLTQVSIYLINQLAALSWSSLSVAKPAIAEIVLFYAILFLIFQLIDERKKKKDSRPSTPLRVAALKYFLVIAVLTAFADIIYLSLQPKLSSDLKITFLDVGQGSSVFVQFPGGENMLIDGGGFSKSSFDVGRIVIAPYLYSQRIHKVDTVVLTHPHPDHLSGLIYILNNFGVRNFWKTDVPIEVDIFPQWEKAIRDNRINPVLFSSQSPEMNIKGVRLKALWPPAHISGSLSSLSYEGVNDSSLVLKITFGKISFLVPGDISVEIEKQLVASGADLKSDVLMIPHHGSIHSSRPEFVRAVGCRWAIVSAGKANVFRHPHPVVVKRYRDAGAEILSSAQHGAVMFTTDGNSVRVESYIKTM